MRSVVLSSIIVGALPFAMSAQDDTARLSGKVIDLVGQGLSKTSAGLRSETAPEETFQAFADQKGVYEFSALPAGEYSLKLAEPGFKARTIKSIHIQAGEYRIMPTIELQISNVADCGGHAVLDYLRLLPQADQLGSLVGSLHTGPVRHESPIAGADVTLMCSTEACGKAKTDRKGDFVITDPHAPPNTDLSIHFSHADFYPLTEPGYSILRGFDSVFWPTYLERCPSGNCDPALRPKRPPALCE